MKQRNEKEMFKTSIGGQALMEGVMMRGPEKYAMAVRKPDGEIQVDITPLEATKKWYAKVPLVRGVFSFVSSLTIGYGCLMKSAEISGSFDDEEEGEQVTLSTGALGAISAVLAVVLCLVLFQAAPTLLVGLLGKVVKLGSFAAVLESIVKMAIFITYMVLVSQMKEIKRVFMCHGAEHKTIACYESGMELTVENVRPFTKYHPRCGTSFLLIVVVISILTGLLISWDSLLIRVLTKIAIIPVVMGISYEILRFAGRHDNWLTRIISAPGMWLQHLTVFEPEDDMIECAIAAIKAVIPEDGSDKW